VEIKDSTSSRGRTSAISVIILTFNERANILEAIDSVAGWAEEIFVVDSYSTDDTVQLALAREYAGVRVVQHEFQNYSQQWNWALSSLPITTDWIMKLDADERATDEFRREVNSAIDNTQSSAFVVHWRLIFMGHLMRWGGYYPNGNIRIWRSGLGRFDDREANEHLIVKGDVDEIRSPIEHHDYKSISHWIDRHNRYSSMEAREISRGNITGAVPPSLFGYPEERRMALRRIYYQLPLRPAMYFVYRYILRLGFLDGRVGFRYALLYSVFLYWIDLKREEFASTGIEPHVIWPARGTPHEALVSSTSDHGNDA
jgi:glycosyltransferase involved in cell wall biosynthesis